MKTTEYNFRDDSAEEALKALETAYAMSNMERLFIHCLVASQKQIDTGLATGQLAVDVTKENHQINHAIDVLTAKNAIQFKPAFNELMEVVGIMKLINIMGTFKMDSEKVLKHLMKNPNYEYESPEYKERVESIQNRVFRNNRMN